MAKPKIAFVFPGQGSQYAGMGRELSETYPVSRSSFDEADDALRFSLSKLCFGGPEEDLQLTANTQPAIVAASTACFRALSERGVNADFVAGHSLGEYSALVAARGLALSTAVKLVRLRGRLMQEAVPVGAGAMAAILGLDAAKVVEVCNEAAQDGVCSPANFNSPAQTVIAGDSAAVERAVEGCKARGAKRAVMLKVSAPFHCALMKPAQDGLEPSLREAAFSDLSLPLVNNVDAEVICNGEQAREGLLRQVTAPVRWTDSIKRLVDADVSIFVEVGPGKVLSGLIKSINRDVRLFNVEDVESLEATVTGIKDELKTAGQTN